MERFAWSFDGIKFSDAEPLRLTYGERLRIVLVNDTMMAHPIHLHGMWSDLEDDRGQFLCASTPWTCRPAASGRSACAPTRSGAGRSTVTCCSTWSPGCSGK
jgi:FtsP/CotA-like multicopper oxidase with cupredoxin domain